MDLSRLKQDPSKFRPIASEIDRIAKDDPERVWAIKPKNWQDLDEGFEDITYPQFAEAIDRAAWFIHDNIGPADPGTFPTLAYCEPSDLGYYIFTIAAVKAGYKLLLLLSGKYTSTSLQHLLDATECRYFLRGEGIEIPQIESFNITFLNAHKEADLLAPSPVEQYKYEPKFPEALNDPFFVIHTSGSSGKQKPIVKTHGNMAVHSSIPEIPKTADGQPILLSIRWHKGPRFSAFPIAHGGGVETGLVTSIHFGCANVVVQNDPLSVQTLLKVVRHTGCRSVLLTPYTCAELVKSPDKSEILENLDIISFAGGPLPAEIGNELSKHVRLVNTDGQTEHTSPMIHLPRPEDWQYVYFTPEWAHCDFRPRGDGIYEAFAIKHPHVWHRYFQPVFWIFPDLDEWAAGGLFTKHPTRPDQWKYAGRADDIIILGSGLSFVPNEYEQTFWRKNSMVKNAIIVGNGRYPLSVVIELNDPSLLQTDRAQVAQCLQETLDEFNKKSTKLCQLSLESLVFCDEGESPPRTGKGTFSRKQIEAAFKERLYRVNPLLQ